MRPTPRGFRCDRHRPTDGLHATRLPATRPAWDPERELEVGMRGRAQLCAIGLKAKEHRGEHGIGDAEIAEQPTRRLRQIVSAGGPNLIDAGDIGLKLAGSTPRGGLAPARSSGIHCAETENPSAFPRPPRAPGARGAIRRQSAASAIRRHTRKWPGSPRFYAAIDEQRERAATATGRRFASDSPVVEINHLLAEFEAGFAQE